MSAAALGCGRVWNGEYESAPLRKSVSLSNSAFHRRRAASHNTLA
jgi:hypothetical protein